jgi:hypothetical protein
MMIIPMRVTINEPKMKGRNPKRPDDGFHSLEKSK